MFGAASKAPALSTIQKMLTNPYYKGQVSFRGATYDGLHEPLVATEVWYRVQAVLTAHQTSGEKTQAHDLLQAHYAGAVPLDLLVVMPDDTVDGQPGEPFNILFDPEVQRTAFARQRATAESGPQTGKRRRFERRRSGGTGGGPNRRRRRSRWDRRRRRVSGQRWALTKPASAAASSELNQTSAMVRSYPPVPGTWYFFERSLPLMV